ncbi:autophagy protein atg9 [Coemansia sp. S146]|nr:autophagy protein atg9 [Coemansia sp. S146]
MDNTSLDNEENAWSTVLTTMASPQQEPHATSRAQQPTAAIPTTAVAVARSPPPSSSTGTAANAANAHTRGLTSTLSGRRQRFDSIPQDQYYSSSPASTVPEGDGSYSRPHAHIYDSQTPVGIVPVLGARGESSNANQDAHGQRQAQVKFLSREHSPALGQQGRGSGGLPGNADRRRGGYANSGYARNNRNSNGDDDDDDDAPPPDSLLIEVPEQSEGSPHGPTHHQDSGPAGFVRRAARAVHTRIQDISSQAADAPRLGGPMPPPRHRSQATYGDGRAFSVAGDASTAWSRRSIRQPRARDNTALSYRERALRAWRDAKHQDEFFCRVYAYYTGKGALALILTRFLQLATLVFVVALSTFVFGCIDHAKVRKQKSLSAVIIPQCTSNFSLPTMLFLWAFAAFWIAQFVRTLLDIPPLLEIRAFFTEVLGVQPADIGTIAWHEVVNRMVTLREVEIREYRNLTKSRILGYRLTADGIVNRIMRRENYMLALFNKDLLDISVPGLGKEQVLTKALEWNLSFCLMNYLFDERGQLRRRFLKESNRAILSEGLRRRFKFMAAINMMFAPFIVLFLVLYSFLRYFEELYHEPGTLSSRAFTPYAKYKFRNFNEVPHSFRARLNSAHPKAALYLSQFRNDALIAVARFVSFVAGSFTALLIVFTVVDNELSLEFEISGHRTVLFYIGLFSAILAAARGMIPTEEQEYLHPAWIIRDALEDLQYMEPEWRGKLDTTMVRRRFESLFTYKLLIFFHELLGVVTAPFIMLFSLPDCAEKVIDFFREFTVNVDGLGYVCSFAAFDFEKHGNVKFSAPTRAPGEHLASKNGKMEQSFLAFKAGYPEWQPRDQAASIYLQRAQNAQQDLWRMGSVVSGAGWQGRLLQQQRMAGSIYPTGASLYRAPNANLGAAMSRIPEDGTNGAPPAPSSGERPAGNMARSQFAFLPPGFAGPSQHHSQQVLASQAMLPFGPTLGGPSAAGKGKQPQTTGQAESAAPTDRLALSSLPLVASPELGNSLDMSVNAGRTAPRAGLFSIVNQLYEQQMM